MIQMGPIWCVAVGRLSVGAAGAVRRPGGWLRLLRVVAEFREQYERTAPVSKYLSSLCSVTFVFLLAKARHRPAQLPGVEKEHFLMAGAAKSHCKGGRLRDGRSQFNDISK